MEGLTIEQQAFIHGINHGTHELIKALVQGIQLTCYAGETLREQKEYRDVIIDYLRVISENLSNEGLTIYGQGRG